MPDDLAMKIHDCAAMLFHKLRLLQKSAVTIVLHETDFHAFLFVSRFERAMARHLASVALGLFAERKQSAGQLLLPQRKKKIALVLALIESALEQGPAAIRARLQPGEMTGGDVLGAKLVGALDEPAEF